MIYGKYAPIFFQKVKVPSLAGLAAKIWGYQYAIQNFASATTMTLSKPSSAHEGDVWYSFYCVGGCMELCRIVMLSNDTMQRTLIARWTASGSTARYTTLSSDNKTLQGTAAVNGGSLVMLKFSVLPKVTDYLFDPNNIDTGTIMQYYGSAYEGDRDDLAVKTSKITEQSGICLATYRDTPSSGTANSVFGFMGTQTSLTMIKGFDSSGWRDTSPLRGYTLSNTSYRVPSSDGTGNARVKSYTLQYLTETWTGEVWV